MNDQLMNTLLWVSVVILSLGVAYAITFGEVTRALGSSLSDEPAGRGYQDAVTPPWQTWFSLLAYVLALVVIALSWREFGFGRAVNTVTVFFAATLVWRRVLPEGHSTHYLKLILTSMTRRYANWVRSGDRVRAPTMAELLHRMGLDVPRGSPAP